MRFITTMIEEKGLANEVLVFNAEGFQQFVPMNVLLGFIETLDRSVQKGIEKKLSQIDFANGNIEDFLIYIAKGMIRL